jgi:ATP-dependent Lhr-like helicase
MAHLDSPVSALVAPFGEWFHSRGWTPYDHQLKLLEISRQNKSALLIAPTGGGKTLAGFLPSLVELAERSPSDKVRGVHTLYISPLKALAVDVARNLERPVAEMKLPIRIETRTGDTSIAKRARQRRNPPDILMTTPEQLALMISSPDAPFLLGDVRRIVLDELHSLVSSKRGDLLSLGLARLLNIAPAARVFGLSATVSDPGELSRFLVPQTSVNGNRAEIVITPDGVSPSVSMLDPGDHLPWAGHSSRYALSEIYKLIKRHHTSLIFVNTRSQAEMVFHELWRLNEDKLAIALHHGSLDTLRRRKVENAMAAGKLRAIVCTSSLDLGVDWGDVDLVIHVGAPKGISRLQQRIGRANHRLDEPSRGVLVPANRFEVIECQAAIEAVAQRVQDTPPIRKGALDVLAQHITGIACAGPFDADKLYREVTSAISYRTLMRKDFDDTLAFVANGGYALKVYDRFAKIRQGADALWRITHPRFIRQHRMNTGTIVEATMVRVRMIRGRNKTINGNNVVAHKGRVLGKVEEYFAENLARGDTFIFAGETLRCEGLVQDELLVSRAKSADPKIPAYDGGKFPLTTSLAIGVRGILANVERQTALPTPVRQWLSYQQDRSELPGANELLVETFPHRHKHFLVCYPFEGRLAHQTLGMLLTRRLERARLRPLGFVATEYSLAIWCLEDVGARIENGLISLDGLFEEDILGDDLEAWLADTALMKRTFRTCAIIAGLIERRLPGREKSKRQVTFSTDLIYDVLRKHEPDHVLLRAAREDTATGMLDIHRLGKMLARIQNKVVHRPLDRVSPLAVPIMLEIGRETVYGEAADVLLSEAGDDLVRHALSTQPERRKMRRFHGARL